MGTIQVNAVSTIDAPATTVYGYIADMREHHPRFLPAAFSNFRVESGGIGSGTVTRFTVTAGGRSRDYHMEVTEPEPGSVLQERDLDSSLVTTFTVTPEGESSRVEIATSWNGASGIGGFFERTFAPKAMRSIYDESLAKLNEYARSQRPRPRA